MENNFKKFNFKGKGGELFLIYLGNIILTILTLGIYSFWGKVRITKFIYNNTECYDEPLNYHATGKEKFLGFLKALAIFAVFGGLMFGLYMGLEKLAGLDPMKAKAVVTVIAYVIILAAIPFIVVGSQRFRLSRSSWKAIRFKFVGTPGTLALIFLKGWILSILTFGIYSPWFFCEVRSFFVNNSHYGNQPFVFTGTGKMLAKTFLVGILLTLVTLGIYAFWFAASLERFTWNNTVFQGKRFECTLRGGDLFGTTIASALLIMFTLGIGFPWAIIMNIRMYLDNLSLEEGIDFAAIKSDYDRAASALSDGLSEASDAMDAVGGMFT